MQLFSTLLLLGTTLLLNPQPTAALGINCRGSGYCTGSGYTSKLLGYIADIQCSRVYKNGEHIACASHAEPGHPKGAICAFLQNTQNGASGASIQQMAQAISDWGCDPCGSSPVTWPKLLGANNDPSAGILTFNYVKDSDNPCPDGLC